MAAIVGVHQLQCPDLRAVQVGRAQQMGGWFGDRDDLDERATEQRDLFPWFGRRGMQQVRGDIVEQSPGPAAGQTGDGRSGLPCSVSPTV